MASANSAEPPAHAPLLGLVRVWANEHPALARLSCLDFEAGTDAATRTAWKAALALHADKRFVMSKMARPRAQC